MVATLIYSVEFPFILTFNFSEMNEDWFLKYRTANQNRRRQRNKTIIADFVPLLNG